MIKICYMDENGKAVPCTHPEKECGPQCPEWKKHKALQDRLPEPAKPAQEQEEPKTPKTLEKRVQDLETAVDNIIGLAYCNRGNAKCPNRPCIYKGKACKHLVLYVPWFKRGQTREQQYEEIIKNIIQSRGGQTTEADIINEMAQYQLSAEETIKLIKNLVEKKAIEIPKTGILKLR